MPYNPRNLPDWETEHASELSMTPDPFRLTAPTPNGVIGYHNSHTGEYVAGVEVEPRREVESHDPTAPDAKQENNLNRNPPGVSEE